MNHYTTVQNQKAVSTYFTSKQILPFGFAERYTGRVDCRIYSRGRQINKGLRLRVEVWGLVPERAPL